MESGVGQSKLVQTDFVPIGMGVKGFGRFVLRDKNLNILQDTGWIPNIITNSGLLWIRDQPTTGYSWCGIGTSTGTPQATDTGLYAPIGTRVSTNHVVTAWGPGNAYLYQRWYGRFLEGNGTGTIAEAGQFNTNSGGTCFSHYRIVDSGGNPTTIVKGSDQILDVYWEVRNYIDASDHTGTIDISGTSYNYLLRPCNLGITSGGNPGSPWAPPTGRCIIYPSGTYQWGFNGDIGPPTGTPSGTLSYGVGSASVLAQGTYFNDCQWECTLDGWNFGGGLRCVSIASYHNRWQIRYGSVAGDLAIPKTNEKRLRLRFRIGVVRV